MTINDGTYYGTLGDDFWQLSLDTPIGYGRAGNDTLFGSDDSNDILYGNRGNDTLFGNDGSDILVGGYGADYLSGGTGGDSLSGGAGNDVLIGYSINFGIEPEFEFDTLEGGTGADIFVLGEGVAFYVDPANELATIVDFSRAEGDKIQVFGSISDYSLEDGPNIGQIYVKYQGNLIADVRYVTDLSLQLDFDFVGSNFV